MTDAINSENTVTIHADRFKLYGNLTVEFEKWDKR